MADEPKLLVQAPVIQDDELQIIAICMAALDRLEAPSKRHRALHYLAERYGADISDPEF